MIRLILPIVLIAASVGIYYYLTDPIINAPLVVDSGSQITLGGVKALKKKKKQLETAIDYIAQLKGKALVIQELAAKISQEDKDRLDEFLPDTINDLQLLVDVDNIGRRSGMIIKDAKLSSDDVKKSRGASDTQVVKTEGVTVAPPIITKVHLSFTAVGSYVQLQSFLSDLSKSLRIMDVEKLSVSAGGKLGAASTTPANDGIYQYQIQLATYWLK